MFHLIWNFAGQTSDDYWGIALLILFFLALLVAFMQYSQERTMLKGNASTSWMTKPKSEKEKAMSLPVISQQEVKSYRPGLFRSSSQKYEHDLERHAERDWRLVSCTVAGRGIFLRLWLTATYERYPRSLGEKTIDSV